MKNEIGKEIWRIRRWRRKYFVLRETRITRRKKSTCSEALWFVSFIKYSYRNQTKMWDDRNTIRKKCIHNFDLNTWRKEQHFGDLKVDEGIQKKHILEIGAICSGLSRLQIIHRGRL
jgi:hypothetical protein